MIELFVTIAFIVSVYLLYIQADNKAVEPPSIPQQSLEQLYAEDGFSSDDTPFIPMLDTTPQMKRDYLKTPQWNTLRKNTLRLANYSCQQCHCTDKPLEVHHTTYERVLNERQSDLVALCRECHQRQHNHYGYSYLRVYKPLI